ncbi:MAG: PilZ domain-containing protein [Deltaproteobacteria bacterium]|nr:PilZ domain-containing protein [Deltaproteobacteria bacterium]
MRVIDMRKYPRYKAKKPIRFSDKVTDGIMVDASREGALIVIESNQFKKIGSYVTFSVYLDGHLPPKQKTTPEIALNKIFNNSPAEATNSDRVKISAKVIRHCQYKGRNAMGLQFLDMHEDHLTRWLTFLGQTKKKQEVLPFGTSNPQKNPEKKKDPGFTIRFQDMKYVKEFLPREPTGEFFIPTKKISTKNKKIRVTLVHPSQEKLLQIEGIVQTCHDKRLGKSELDGLQCSFASITNDLIHRINNFLEETIYTPE